MSDDLAKRFGWWWRGKNILCRIGPHLERVAFYYELASRAEKGKKPRYLLGKRFDKLTRAQMWEMNRYWPRRPLNVKTFYDYRYNDDPFELEKLHRELRQIRSRWSDDRRMLAKMSPPTRKEVGVRDKFERAHAKETGWTLPLYFTFNLRQCGNTTTLNELEKWIKQERKRLGIEAPKANKGRSNRSSEEGVLFRRVEALDVWRNLPHNDDAQNAYDPTGGEARRAQSEAKRLRREWEANRRMWMKYVQ